MYDDGGDDGSDGGGKKRLETKNLEELGEGYMRARQEGQLITVREKWADLRVRVGDKMRRRARGGGRSRGYDGPDTNGAAAPASQGPVEMSAGHNGGAA